MMERFYVGMKVTMYIAGAGTVSTETHTIESIEDGVIRLTDSDKTFNSKSGLGLEVDTIFGFRFHIE